MSTAIWIGGGVALAGLAVVLLELALLTPRLMRLTKRIKQLNLLLAENARLNHDELDQLHRSQSQLRLLLGPYRRILRWLRHPITLALLASYRRKLARRSSSSVG